MDTSPSSLCGDLILEYRESSSKFGVMIAVKGVGRETAYKHNKLIAKILRLIKIKFVLHQKLCEN